MTLVVLALVAQGYVAYAIGGNLNRPATVSLRAGPALSLDFHRVRFAAKPFEPRRYFLIRGGYLSPSGWGVETEYLHFKALADTSRDYRVTVGPGTALTPADAQPMNAVIQTYTMNSGVNLLTGSVVRRYARGARGALLLRVGGGVTFPYADTTVQGQTVQHYEFGGPAVKAGSAVELRLLPHVLLSMEYQVTWVRPEIDVAGGRAWTNLWSHHGAVGLRFPF